MIDAGWHISVRASPMLSEMGSGAYRGGGMSPRSDSPSVSRDPLAWCWLMTAAFLALVLHRLAIPTKPNFDEIHYKTAKVPGLSALSRISR